MASIDAFWKLAAGAPVSKTVQRLSLRRLASAATSAIERRAERQRAWILVGVALLHVLFLLALRVAMHPLTVVHHQASTPLQITFIERRPALVVPTQIVTPPAPVVPRQTSLQSRSLPPPIALRTDALQAVTIASPVKPVETAPPRAVLFDATGGLRVPEAPMPSKPRDLLAHGSVSFMLPGGGRESSPDLHVREGASPQKVVEGIGALLFGGGHFDPCPSIAQDMVDLDDAKTREDAEERYEKSCEGH